MRDHRRSLSLLLSTGLLWTVSAAGAADAGRSLPDRYVRGGLDGPVVLVDHPHDGTTWSAWAWRDGGEYDIAVSVRDADGTWTEPRRFGAHDGIDQVDPDLIVDGTGTVYLAWAERQTGRIRVAVRVGGFADWVGPETIGEAGVHASEPALGLIGGRLVIAFRTAEGIELLDFPTIPSQSPIGTRGIQEGPDVIDPLGREVDRGDGRSGEEAGTSEGTAWRNRPGTSPGAEVRNMRPRPPSSQEP